MWMLSKPGAGASSATMPADAGAKAEAGDRHVVDARRKGQRRALASGGQGGSGGTLCRRQRRIFGIIGADVGVGAAQGQRPGHGHALWVDRASHDHCRRIRIAVHGCLNGAVRALASSR